MAFGTQAAKPRGTGTMTSALRRTLCAESPTALIYVPTRRFHLFALDIATLAAEKQPGMSILAPDFYARWRAEHLAPSALRETGALAQPDERLLQLIWLHQRLRREALRTLDGLPVAVLHPGFLNREAGPDFRGAILQIGAQPPGAGDVEVDLRPANWSHHCHDQNPAYGNVRLHVVWDAGPGAKAGLPTMPIRNVLDAPLDELRLWLDAEAAPALPAAQAGLCSPLFRDLPAGLLRELLLQAARVRLERKASQLEARAKVAGWEQALWEGLFAALGYKHNVWPMRRLAELLPRLLPLKDAPPLSTVALQARLLGVGGLLPAELTRTQAATDAYLRSVWDHWWRDRDAYADCLLPRSAWCFHGLRPANHPQRRLALAAAWLDTPDWLPRLEGWLAEDLPDDALADSLTTRLQPTPDPFWSRHYTLVSASLPRPQPLLGAPRATDLAVNVILPWFWQRAVAGKNEPLRRRVERCYFAWPAAEDNAVLRSARQRLLGGARLAPPRTAALQQGLIQVVRDFCDHSNALCAECRFSEVVRRTLRGEVS